jgi:hypothetical protein
VVAGALVGNRASGLVAPGGHSSRLAHLGAMADRSRGAGGQRGTRRGKRRPFVLRCPARHPGIAVPAPCRPGR